jgi:CHAD domain-containing protein
MARRTSAQEQLEEAYNELGPDLERLKIETLSGKELRKTTLGRVTLKRMARQVLSEHLAELESAGRSARNQEQLHQMRIAGKRLRYAMEIFGECFGSEFRKVLYPRVEALQEILGTVNDAYNAAQTYRNMEAACRRFFPGLWPQWREGIRYLIAEQMARRKRAMNEFKEFWRQWRKEDMAGQFDAVLG